MNRYDIAIIGTGPAGLSAALTAKARNKSVLLFGSEKLSDKVAKAHEVNNYLGLPAVTGSQMQQAFLDHINSQGIVITPEKVTMAFPMGDYFSIQTSANQMYEATAVIVASGVIAGKPYPGEEEFLGRGVSYCATCDAALYRDKRAAVIAFSPEEEAEAELLSEFASEVLYFPMYKGPVHVREGIRIMEEKPEEILGGMKADRLQTRQGSFEVDGVFILRESIAPAQLIPGLELDGSHIRVERDMSTNTPGCFAAGDITGQPYQYIKSAGEGNVAAISAAKYIDNLQKQKGA